ncbi:DMT family transporter [Oceanibacterium hippocampi]|uniref:Riboflavin transporter n=1 Tax=Oceanibacterium hippocampi TaxID=745714 RepID=A0A1Y5TEN6_9PROT|nr:DMT family transporter [Oceanibacterium hippocampi]SLN60220.1 Riboflavin transporter [Oceanibacterium hippocampi]
MVPSSIRAIGARMSGNTAGVLLMALGGICFAGFMAIVRYLGSDMNPVQAAFLRYFFGLILMLPILLRLRIVDIVGSSIRWHIMRGMAHGTGVMLWFYAMARVPLAEVTALGFTSPVFVTIGAALFLGERIRIYRIGAIVLGLVGVLIILRPGVAAIEPGAAVMLIAAPLFAMSDLIAKRLTRTDPALVIVAFLSVSVTVMIGPVAYFIWRTPTIAELIWLFLTAALATGAHLAMAQAFKVADLGVTQPVRFLQLVWAALIGYVAFGEAPDAFTWIGSAVIVTSAGVIMHREMRLRRSLSVPGIADKM